MKGKNLNQQVENYLYTRFTWCNPPGESMNSFIPLPVEYRKYKEMCHLHDIHTNKN